MVQKRITLFFLCAWWAFAGVSAQQVSLLEYWLDNDATSRERVTGGSGGAFSFEVDANALSPGIHTLSIRTQDDDGLWGSPMTHYFLRMAPVPQQYAVSQYEYWIDHDGRSVHRAMADADGLLSLTLDVDSLATGIHTLSVRAQDNGGQWGAPMTHYFYHSKRLHESRIVGFQYWFNTAYDHAIYQVINPGKTEVEINKNVMTRDLLEREPTAEELESGEKPNLYLGVENQLHYRFQDDTGAWSQPETDTFVYMGEGEVMILAHEDWQLLRQAHAMTGGDGWTAQWEFGETAADPVVLPGVTAANDEGHVTAIDVTDFNLCGPFPFPLLQLPALHTLTLAQNHLEGDVSTGIAEDTEAASLRTLNIVDNQLSGNIGLLAAHCPQLTTLDARRNRLESVQPFISPAVTSLSLGGQTIGSTALLHIGQLSAETVTTALPSILTYDHAAQRLSPDISLACTTADGDWKAQIAYQDERLVITPQSADHTYRGQSGDTLQAVAANHDGTTLPLCLLFEEGDANMDGEVDVLDLQTDVNVIMETHGNRLLNFTAADLWTDEQINAQDAVMLVNLLLNNETTEESRRNKSYRSEADTSGAELHSALCLKDRHLLLYSSTPVAAFDITLSGSSNLAVASTLRQQGFSCTVCKSDRGMRLIAYSPSGNTLPVGTTLLATTTGGRAVAAAKLADVEAQPVSVVLNALPTGIDDVQTDDSSPDCYDLSGRKIEDSRLCKGIYIRQNRKLVK